ncbi:DUF6263 family protein [Verrucomicrobiota bacterium]
MTRPHHHMATFTASIVVCILLTGSGCAGGPVELKQKLTPGQRLVYTMATKQSSETTTPALPQPVKQRSDQELVFGISVVKELPDDAREIEFEYLSVKADMTVGGVKMTYDSANPGQDTANMLAMSMGKLLGTKLTCRFDKDGDMTGMEGMEELMSEMHQGQSAGGMFDDESFKQLFGEKIGGGWLPENPVKVGDSWSVSKTASLGGMTKMSTDVTYTFKGWQTEAGRRCAEVYFEGTISGEPGNGEGPMGMQMSVKAGAMSGTALFDPELGSVVRMVTDQTMQMGMSMTAPAGQAQDMETKLEQTVTISLSEVGKIE